ncbi:MAG: metallophosphoesterase [Burkholderiaceae bacterium]|nr:metallophosphoesterase [Burkholderiaceae bacterium]
MKRALFTFAVVADTHVNEAETSTTSPYETNRWNNPRARHVFREIAAMDPAPDFVIHLGDIVHPVPSLPEFDVAVAHFRDMTADMPMPVHLLPGNHDVGDKRIDWMPADQVCDDYLLKYRAAFGDDFHAFEAQGVRFVMINSLLLNSGLADEQRQREWLEAQIDTAAGRRVFLFMHYPPYVHKRDERGSYDNVDEPARSWLLGQIERPGVEAVFAGHVHNFWYDRVGTAEFYMLPSTAFLRHDYTEFYRVAPATEFGRGDAAKFGYFLVDVHEDGHVAHPIRTMGAMQVVGEDGPSDPLRPSRLLAHPKTARFERVGVELRHPWAETQQITATGGVQEFGRKWARNDYPLLALWEMGARLAKTTDQDLLDDATRERMNQAAAGGLRFVVTSLGAPLPALHGYARAAGVRAFEANLTLAGFERARDALRTARERSGAKILFSKLLSYDPSQFDGTHFAHVIKAGFTLDELQAHVGLIREACAAKVIDGVSVRLEDGASLLEAARRLETFLGSVPCELLVSIKLAGQNAARVRDDDARTAALAAQAMVLSRAGERVQWVFDTFMDVDRGYYPRHAFIDRRFDPRPAAHVFTALNACFPDEDRFVLGEAVDAGESACGAIEFTAGPGRFALIWGNGEALEAWLLEFAPDAMVRDLCTHEAGRSSRWRQLRGSGPAVLLVSH